MALYAGTNDRIMRYALPAGAIVPTAPPDTILSGPPLTGDHPMHPSVIDAQGALHADLCSATNACQVQSRIANSPGRQPCTELETRAGTWRYDANRTEQHFSPVERFATGLRNGEGFAFAGRIYATQHGRDQLRENWPTHRSGMPPMGGAELTPSQVAAVAAHMWALNHRKPG
jgi:glucose/arabinose dehydrogenase